MKKVLLLGGNGDIGQAILNKFTVSGYDVIAPSRQVINLEDISSIDKYFENNKGDFDILVYCAGYNTPKPIEEVTIEDINKTNSVNYIGFYRIIQHVIPYFKEMNNGHILGISSLYGIVGREKRSPYVMSKHALNGLVKTVAIELGKYNVKVNTLSPGFVDTKMTRKNNTDEKIRSFEEKIPLGHLAKPEDIAEVAYFLCSPNNTYISGQDIIVDGGFIAGGFQN